MGDGRKDITWLRSDGAEMQLADWKDPALAALAFCLEGDPSVLVLMNGERAPTAFRVRAPPAGPAWRVAFDAAEGSPTAAVRRAATSIMLAPWEPRLLAADAPAEA